MSWRKLNTSAAPNSQLRIARPHCERNAKFAALKFSLACTIFKACKSRHTRSVSYCVVQPSKFEMSNSNAYILMRLRCPVHPRRLDQRPPLPTSPATRAGFPTWHPRTDVVRISFPTTRLIKNTRRKHNTASIPATGFEPAFPPDFDHSERSHKEADGGALTIRPHRLNGHMLLF